MLPDLFIEFMEFRTFKNTGAKPCDKIKLDNSAIQKISLTELVKARKEIFRHICYGLRQDIFLSITQRQYMSLYLGLFKLQRFLF